MSDTYKDKADRLGVPLIEKLPPRTQGASDPNPVTAVCGQCGLEVRKVMFFTCSHVSCPVFSRGAYGSAGGAFGSGVSDV